MIHPVAEVVLVQIEEEVDLDTIKIEVNLTQIKSKVTLVKMEVTIVKVEGEAALVPIRGEGDPGQAWAEEDLARVQGWLGLAQKSLIPNHHKKNLVKALVRVA